MPTPPPPPASALLEKIQELWPWFIVFLVLWVAIFIVRLRGAARDRQTAAKLDELIKNGRPPGNE